MTDLRFSSSEDFLFFLDRTSLIDWWQLVHLFSFGFYLDRFQESASTWRTEWTSSSDENECRLAWSSGISRLFCLDLFQNKSFSRIGFIKEKERTSRDKVTTRLYFSLKLNFEWKQKKKSQSSQWSAIGTFTDFGHDFQKRLFQFFSFLSHKRKCSTEGHIVTYYSSKQTNQIHEHTLIDAASSEKANMPFVYRFPHHFSFVTVLSDKTTIQCYTNRFCPTVSSLLIEKNYFLKNDLPLSNEKLENLNIFD